MVRTRAMRTLENAMRRWGFYRVAGCDEVGRGCLAGPVVAAAVILDPDRYISGVCDSKMITAAERERLYGVITRKALAWAVASAPAGRNRRHQHPPGVAAGDAAGRAVDGAAARPRPGGRVPDSRAADRAAPVLHGDRRCSAIAAASIIAKVTRDREMLVHHAADPRYGYDRHKGYATADHLAAVARHGYSTLHRRSFRPPSLFDTIE